MDHYKKWKLGHLQYQTGQTTHNSPRAQTKSSSSLHIWDKHKIERKKKYTRKKKKQFHGQ
ncbi:hypothetical protein HanRHA438_Chr09g0425731 [Helianthus annuus]|nr:hypothetical protein HanRHA438_Chr09g0425731 [Helianthus annuus]